MKTIRILWSRISWFERLLSLSMGLTSMGLTCLVGLTFLGGVGQIGWSTFVGVTIGLVVGGFFFVLTVARFEVSRRRGNKHLPRHRDPSTPSQSRFLDPPSPK